MHCLSCQLENPPENRFCGGCGAPLGRRDAERRQLTVLFSDLVDSTALASELDPEDLREVVSAYHQACAAVIERRGGHIDQYLGDGVLALFGYPMAREDAAVQAAQAGLDLLEELEALNDRLEADRGVRLAVRIGMHSGLTLVGPRSPSSTEAAALGRTVHLAARLQGAALPGEVLLSGDTLRLIEGRFHTEEAGPYRLKGVEEPVAAHRLLARTVARSRLESAGARGLTPFVGREAEIALVLDGFERAGKGVGEVVLLEGDPGIGKSRLVHVVRERLAGRCNWLEGHCSIDHRHSALFPVIRLLERELAFSEDETPRERRGKLERALEERGLVDDDVPPLLAALLSLPAVEGERRPALSPEVKRRRTLEALATWLRSLAAQQTVVLVVEDLHWIDPSTLALLGSIVAQVADAPILVLLTSRPGFTPPWSGEAQTRVSLDPLPPEQNPALIEGVLGGRELPAEAVEQVIERADGVPLFLEELTRAVLESVGSPVEIPATLQDTLVARLDRLGPAREVAQLAAVVGREFPYRILEAVSSLAPASLRLALDELRSADLIRETESPDVYLFKHALVREAAYQLTMRSTRRDLHKLIADALREHFPEIEERQPERIAHHLEAAGQTTAAIGYLQRAADRGLARCAWEESLHHVDRGLALCRHVDEVKERLRLELGLRITRGTVLFSTRGYGAPEVAETFGRAQELCEALDEELPLQVLNGLWAFHVVRSDLAASEALLPRFRLLAQRRSDPVRVLQGRASLGVWCFFRGDYVAARDHLTAAIELYPTPEFQRFRRDYGYDGGFYAYGYGMSSLYVLGELDASRAVRDEMSALADAETDPYTCTMIGGFLASVFGYAP